jgi:hypothetical protein
MATSRIGFMVVITPDPGGADAEIDQEPGADADQVRQHVEDAKRGERLQDTDIDPGGGQGDQVESGEPAGGQRTDAKRPDLMPQVVVHDRQLGRDRRGRRQGQPAHPVQQEQREIVDPHSDDSDDREPAWLATAYARNPHD